MDAVNPQDKVAQGAAANGASSQPGTDPKAAARLGRVVVLMGGRSGEREISLRTGGGVLAALQRRGVDAEAFDPGVEPLSRFVEQAMAGRWDRAMVSLHGRWGEDGTMQGLLELLGLPYTGSGVLASSLAMDKIATKEIWSARGLPTPAWKRLDAEAVATAESRRAIADALGLPLIVKPAHEGSSLGLTKVTDPEQLADAYPLASRSDDAVVAEAFVAGRELTVAILGEGTRGPGAARALPVIEIRAPQGNYDYQNKYFTNDTQYLCPAPLPPAVADEVARVAVEAFVALGCSGWGRCDVMLAGEGDDARPFLLEMNTSPGMTDHSLVPMAARAVGIDYDELVVRLAASASLKVGSRPTGAAAADSPAIVAPDAAGQAGGASA